MATVSKVFFRGTPGYYDSVLSSWNYQTIDVASGKTAVITNIIVVNTSTSNAYGLSIQFNGVPVLGSGNPSSGELPAGSTTMFDLKQVVNSGQPISVAAGLNNGDVYIHVSGVEIS